MMPGSDLKPALHADVTTGLLPRYEAAAGAILVSTHVDAGAAPAPKRRMHGGWGMGVTCRACRSSTLGAGREGAP